MAANEKGFSDRLVTKKGRQVTFNDPFRKTFLLESIWITQNFHDKENGNRQNQAADGRQ